MTYIYADPLGNIQDISYNHIDKLLSKKRTKKAQIKDLKKKYKIDKIQLFFWSIVCILLILVFLIFLRNTKNF